jgi:hypothetical protein
MPMWVRVVDVAGGGPVEVVCRSDLADLLSFPSKTAATSAI